MPDTTVELLLSVAREAPLTLGAQIEDQLRRAIREGGLRPGAAMPSTRDLASQLGVSRHIVVDAYSQLAAEGYLVLRQGARPRVSGAAAGGREMAVEAAIPAAPPRYDFRPSVPDASSFPRAAWLRALREAVSTIPDVELVYGDPRGVERLRAALADYLGRVRGVVADPDHIVITCGYTQGQDLVCRTLAERGARRIAIEDPGDVEWRLVVERAGVEAVPVAVDDEGISVEELEQADADAVLLTPAHQHPTGVVLSGARRTALLAWLRRRDAFAIEDDYDAEYRYDRMAVGALQGLAPARVVYGGSVSKTLAPALRLGWVVLPSPLVEGVASHKLLADRGTARIDQHALASFLARGDLDRHLRRMRARYRAKRDAIVAAVEEELPRASVRGIAAGLHATVELANGPDEGAIAREAARRRVALTTMHEYRHTPSFLGPPTLLLGYANVPEAAIRPGVREIAEAVRAVS
jgi:GntR family transcriptional regulator / MocR family aminotransferase